MMSFKMLARTLLPAVIAICTGCGPKPEYSRESVQPLVVERLAEDRISIQYQVPPATMHFSKGVDYISTDGVLKIFILKCMIDRRCEPMAESVIPLDGRWRVEVHLPYRGEKIVFVHADGEQEVRL